MLTVTGGALLNVAGTPWTLNGTMSLGAGALVQGQTLTMNVAILSAGTYSLTPMYFGSTFPMIQAPLIIDPNTISVLSCSGASLGGIKLDGPTTWAGGSVISAPYTTNPYGVLVQDGNATS